MLKVIAFTLFFTTITGKVLAQVIGETILAAGIIIYGAFELLVRAVLGV